MNFFKGVKQKLSSVGDDITKSLNFRTPRKDNDIKQITIDDCSFMGGAQLLEKYQNDWSSLHDGNENIAKTAHRIDGTIGVLHDFVTQRHVQYSQMSQLISTDLPRLESDLDNICSVLSDLTTALERTEMSLTELEDQIEWSEVRKREAEAQANWQAACRRSAAQIESARVKRAQAHADRMARSERLRQESLRERAATFEEEFYRDVQYYREHGKVERTLSHASATEEELAGIKVSNEDDEAALNDFLEEEAPEVEGQQHAETGTETESPQEDTDEKEVIVEESEQKPSSET